MIQYYASLEALLDSIDPTDQIESLKTFAAIDALVRELSHRLDSGSYIREKLLKFRYDVLYAVAPGEETRHHTPSFYLSQARSELDHAKYEAFRKE